jgi:hypothetical protein
MIVSRKDEWERSYLCPSCQSRNLLSYPDFSILMLKYFMQLAVGITSGEYQKKQQNNRAQRKFFKLLSPRKIYVLK